MPSSSARSQNGVKASRIASARATCSSPGCVHRPVRSVRQGDELEEAGERDRGVAVGEAVPEEGVEVVVRRGQGRLVDVRRVGQDDVGEGLRGVRVVRAARPLRRVGGHPDGTEVDHAEREPRAHLLADVLGHRVAAPHGGREVVDRPDGAALARRGHLEGRRVARQPVGVVVGVARPRREGQGGAAAAARCGRDGIRQLLQRHPGALGVGGVDDVERRRRHRGGDGADRGGNGIHAVDRLRADAERAADAEGDARADAEERDDRHGRAPAGSTGRRHGGEASGAVW